MLAYRLRHDLHQTFNKATDSASSFLSASTIDQYTIILQTLYMERTDPEGTIGPNEPTGPIKPSSTNVSDQPIQGTVLRPQGSQDSLHKKTIYIITGPAGCGKSTLAMRLAKKLSAPYVEGDEFHTQANVTKMASGKPLADSDRWDWLTRIRNHAVSLLQRTSTTSGSEGVQSSSFASSSMRSPSQTTENTVDAPTSVVVACSALKRAYRDVLRGQIPPSSVTSFTSKSGAAEIETADRDISVHFIYLRAPEELIAARVRSRQGHYMKEEMVKSQFLELEEPSAEELRAQGTVGDCDVLDLQTGPGDEGSPRMLNIDEVFEQVEKVVSSPESRVGERA